MTARIKRHPNLNAILIVGAGVFFGYAAATVSPSALTRTSGEMLASASVSISAAVPQNPYNSLAEQLREKEAALQERERAAGVGPSAAGAEPVSTLDDKLGVLSLFVSLILLVLVAINFYLDMRREGRVPMLSNPFAVDLRRRS